MLGRWLGIWYIPSSSVQKILELYAVSALKVRARMSRRAQYSFPTGNGVSFTKDHWKDLSDQAVWQMFSLGCCVHFSVTVLTCTLKRLPAHFLHGCLRQGSTTRVIFHSSSNTVEVINYDVFLRLSVDSSYGSVLAPFTNWHGRDTSWSALSFLEWYL